MTPTLPELLLGNFLTFVEPPPPEAMGEFLAGKVAVVGLINLLASQEAERGAAACVWENGSLRALFARTAGTYDAALGGKLAEAARGRDEDFSLTALAEANAVLRRMLIDLHVAAEQAGDRALDREILQLYAEMADHRRLDLPPLPAS
jgi:hypothetical protein